MYRDTLEKCEMLHDKLYRRQLSMPPIVYADVGLYINGSCWRRLEVMWSIHDDYRYVSVPNGRFGSQSWFIFQQSSRRDDRYYYIKTTDKPHWEV